MARHFAFGCKFEEIADVIEWSQSRGVQPRRDAPFEPTVRTYQANASVYFDDPDGNSLEIMCALPVEIDPEGSR